MNDPTVFIVDDNPETCQSLRKTIESTPFPVETHLSADSFLSNYSIYRGGCLFLDVHMPGMDGLQLQKHLNSYKYRLPIIFMTGKADIQTAVKAVRNGAMEYLEKPLDATQVIHLVTTAINMDVKRKKLRLHYDAICARINNLTPRERQVLERVLHQETNRSIAGNLGVSVKTIEFHRSKVMQKMHAHSLLELAEMVRENEVLANGRHLTH